MSSPAFAVVKGRGRSITRCESELVSRFVRALHDLPTRAEVRRDRKQKDMSIRKMASVSVLLTLLTHIQKSEDLQNDEEPGTAVLSGVRIAQNPAEQFIRDAVSEHCERRGLTPEFLADQLDPDNSDGFTFNYQSQVELIARHQRMYHRSPRRPRSDGAIQREATRADKPA